MIVLLLVGFNYPRVEKGVEKKWYMVISVGKGSTRHGRRLA
jgi:hypothetical protein